MCNTHCVIHNVYTSGVGKDTWLILLFISSFNKTVLYNQDSVLEI